MKQYKYGGLLITSMPSEEHGHIWIAWYKGLGIVQELSMTKVQREIKRLQLAREFPYDKRAVL